METFFVWVLIAYLLGFIVTIWALLDTPATRSLVFLRAGVWPYYWITGKPTGTKFPMD